MARYNVFNHLGDLQAVLPLQLLILRSRVDPQRLVEHVFFLLEQIADDRNGRMILEVCVVDDQWNARWSVSGRWYNFDILVEDERLLLIIVAVINVLVRPARADEVRRVEEQVEVADVIRMAVGANNIINLLRLDMMKTQLAVKYIAIPRGQRVELK